MKIESRNPKKLKPHPMNPKLHTEEQVEHVSASIKKFDFTQPIVVDEHDTILAGHARTKAAIANKMKTVPVVVVAGLSEAEKLALCLSDNHLAHQTPIDTLKAQAIQNIIFKSGEDHSDVGIPYEYVAPEERDEAPEETNSIKQIVILFEKEVFEAAQAKFSLLMEKHPELQDNTDVFRMLFKNYVEQCER